jgi:hypothetical protein
MGVKGAGPAARAASLAQEGRRRRGTDTAWGRRGRPGTRSHRTQKRDPPPKTARRFGSFMSLALPASMAAVLAWGFMAPDDDAKATSPHQVRPQAVKALVFGVYDLGFSQPTCGRGAAVVLAALPPWPSIAGADTAAAAVAWPLPPALAPAPPASSSPGCAARRLQAPAPRAAASGEGPSPIAASATSYPCRCQRAGRPSSIGPAPTACSPSEASGLWGGGRERRRRRQPRAAGRRGAHQTGAGASSTPRRPAPPANPPLRPCAETTTNPRAFYAPESEEDVRAIVADCHAKGRKLRVVGSGLSPNGAGFGGGGCRAGR